MLKGWRWEMKSHCHKGPYGGEVIFALIGCHAGLECSGCCTLGTPVGELFSHVKSSRNSSSTPVASHCILILSLASFCLFAKDSCPVLGRFPLQSSSTSLGD
eukprot:3236569-Ditylum_brightwellii.AAC.1